VCVLYSNFYGNCWGLLSFTSRVHVKHKKGGRRRDSWSSEEPSTSFFWWRSRDEMETSKYGIKVLVVIYGFSTSYCYTNQMYLFLDINWLTDTMRQHQVVTVGVPISPSTIFRHWRHSVRHSQHQTLAEFTIKILVIISNYRISPALLQHGIPFLLPLKIVRPYIVSSAT